MSSEVLTSPTGLRLAEALQPWMTEDLERACESIGVMFDPVYELAEEEGERGEAGWTASWEKLFDVERCPAKYLPYLGQFVGVEVPKTATEAEARRLIREEQGYKRGTLAAVTLAARNGTANGKANLFKYYPSFEGAGPSHWVCQFGEHTSTEAQAYVGSRSMLLEATGSNGLVSFWDSQAADRVAVTPGQQITISMYIRAFSASRTCKAVAVWFNAAGAELGSTTGSGVADNATGWVRPYVTATVPAEAASVRVTGSIEGAVTGEKHYCDAVQVNEGPLGEYADGSLLGYGWMGAENESATGKLGTGNATIIERTAANGSEDAYHFLVVVKPTELPAHLPSGQTGLEYLKAKINETKPGGVFFTVIEAEGYPWSTATKKWNEEGTLTWLGAAHIAP